MVITRVAVPLPAPLWAVSATVVLPAVVGVPAMMPVCGLRTSPAGSGVATKSEGELVPVIW